MLIDIKHEKSVNIVTLPEELVYANAEQIKKEIFTTILNEGNRLALDLSNTSFIDSSGLAVLVSAFKKIQELKGVVVFASPTNNARLLIELTRLDQIFDIYDDLQTAIEEVNAA